MTKESDAVRLAKFIAGRSSASELYVTYFYSIPGAKARMRLAVEFCQFAISHADLEAATILFLASKGVRRLA